MPTTRRTPTPADRPATTKTARGSSHAAAKPPVAAPDHASAHRKAKAPSRRVAVRRHAERGAYEREAVHAILDAGRIAHVGFVLEGQPYVIPMGYARQGERLVLHGAVTSRMFRHLADGLPCCVTVTHLDGLVLARSVFSHSMNYRSVVVLGTATPIRDPAEKLAALHALTEQLAPGRWDEARVPDRKELAATEVLALPLDEASAKVRTGGPKDMEKDLALPVWAGVLPLALQPGKLIPAEGLAPGLPLPAVAKRRRRRA
jgi:nitroimidazol reductase NimA-like FMN-containing flavoprotein (pyridoxamine 5'-phosphate oxidase superfamily)